MKICLYCDAFETATKDEVFQFFAEAGITVTSCVLLSNRRMVRFKARADERNEALATLNSALFNGHDVIAHREPNNWLTNGDPTPGHAQIFIHCLAFRDNSAYEEYPATFKATTEEIDAWFRDLGLQVCRTWLYEGKPSMRITVPEEFEQQTLDALNGTRFMKRLVHAKCDVRPDTLPADVTFNTCNSSR